MSSQQQINCNKCKKDNIELLASRNKCNKCKDTFYCTRSCKKSDWEVHKKTCGKPTPNIASSPNLHVNFAITPGQIFTQTSVIDDTADFGPMMTITLTLPNTTSPDEKELRRDLTQPDTSITAENVGNTKIWLSALPEQKCYESIIDAYRFRIEDEHTRGDVRTGTLYDGSYPLNDFLKFLDGAQENDVLPDWWSQENKKSCQDWALDEDNDACIFHELERQDIVAKYGYLGLVQLRALAEDIYGSPVFG